jgi:hypothetical protein
MLHPLQWASVAKHRITVRVNHKFTVEEDLLRKKSYQP